MCLAVWKRQVCRVWGAPWAGYLLAAANPATRAVTPAGPEVRHPMIPPRHCRCAGGAAAALPRPVASPAGPGRTVIVTGMARAVPLALRVRVALQAERQTRSLSESEPPGPGPAAPGPIMIISSSSSSSS